MEEGTVQRKTAFRTALSVWLSLSPFLNLPLGKHGSGELRLSCLPETEGESAQRKESVWLSTQSQSKLLLDSLGIAFAELIVSEPAGGGLVLTVQGLALANSKKTSAGPFSSMVEVWHGAKAGVGRSQLVPK